jgi:hypothetical protein
MQVPSWELCFAVTLVKNFLSWDWTMGIFMFLNVTVFYSRYFWFYGLKPSAESKQASKAKAAAENTPPNVIRDRIIALIFSVFTYSSGLRLNKPVVQ